MPLRLLDRYILKRLVDTLLLGVVVFTLVLFFSDTLLDFMKDLERYGIPWDIAYTLVGLQIPRIVSIVIPMSALLATLMAYNHLNNQFELIAMRMSGISLSRLARPALLIGLLASLTTFILHDYVAPTCNKYARALKSWAIQEQNLPTTQENFSYKQFDDNQQLRRLLYISGFEGKTLGYTTLIDLTNPKTLQVIQATSGLWGSPTITLNNANVYTVTSNQKLFNTTHLDKLALQNFIRPEKPVSEFKPRELSFIGLWQWMQAGIQKGKTFPADIYVTLWEKLTVPMASLPLVLLAVPLATSGPRKLTNWGFLGAIFILFGYYLLRHVSVQLGNAEILPPLMAASLPVIVLSVLAGVLFKVKNQVL